MAQIERFLGLNRLAHPAAEIPKEYLYASKNTDYFKEGQVSPRDGLSRPDLWPGAFFTEAGNLRGDENKSAAIGSTVRSLIPVGTEAKSGPVLLFSEDA